MSVPGGWKQLARWLHGLHAASWEAARITWTAYCKLGNNEGLQGLHVLLLQEYPSQPGGPKGAGGYYLNEWLCASKSMTWC